METNNNKEMQLQCQQLGPTLLFDKLMELQDLWTAHIESICDGYAKTDANVHKFANALRNSCTYPFGIDIRQEFTRHDSTFVNMTCKINSCVEDVVRLEIESYGFSIFTLVKMEYLLNQDKPTLVKKLWTEHLQKFLKQTEAEIVSVKDEYDSKMLAIARLKVELEN